MRRLRSILFPCLIVTAMSAIAADEESGLWAAANLTKKINEKFTADTALQLRFDNDIETLERVLLRPSISYRLHPQQALTVGYDAHFIQSPRDRVEQRLWQQYQINQAYSSVIGTLRLRLEERFIDHVDGVPVRIRVKAGAKIPFTQSPWFFSVANEAFFGFNEIRGGQRDGFHENRAFAGIGRALGEGLVGQIGYQNQFFDGRARDRMIHQVFISLGVSLP